jgi:FADH2 O2-dependent halogenase
MRHLRRPQLTQSTTPETYDIAVVGSGFAGSLIAMIARRLGRSVVLIERGTHPRIVIGESSTPLSNLLLEELATRYRLAEIRPLSKWGTWQRAHPEIPCGLKRGFTFYHHYLSYAGAAIPSDPEHHRQLLVAASPHDAIADTHWYRAGFDHFLVQAAERAGVHYHDNVHLTRFTDCGNHVLLEGRVPHAPEARDGGLPASSSQSRAIAFRVRFVIDATGPRGFLHHALNLGELPVGDMPPTQALYSHFCNVGRLGSAQSADDHLPYPPDDAAVHHIFPGGWIWVLQFNNGVTSAGVACTDETAAILGFADPVADSGSSDAQSRYADAWDRLLARIPALHQQFARARPLNLARAFTRIPRLTFRSGKIAGRNWVLLPSAAGFVDPLLSTGFPLTLLGIQRLAAILESGWESPEFATRLQTYAAQTDADLLAASRLIAALYASMDNFPVFNAISMLYFAAVSYAESARRLGKPNLAPSFLLHDDPRFGPAAQALLDQSRTIRTPEEVEEFLNEVSRVIDPFNVAGLANPVRRNWYPVDANDLLDNADKLNARREEIEQLLDRCGFYANAQPG